MDFINFVYQKYLTQGGMWGLYLMLFIMLLFSPWIVSTALKQTKQDIEPHDKKKTS